MTSDAKIGLLLGLVFIFVIAFIINGLPNFGDHAKAEATTMMSVQGDNMGVADNARAAQKRLDWEDLIDQGGEDLAAVPKTPVEPEPALMPTAIVDTMVPKDGEVRGRVYTLDDLVGGMSGKIQDVVKNLIDTIPPEQTTAETTPAVEITDPEPAQPRPVETIVQQLTAPEPEQRPAPTRKPPTARAPKIYVVEDGDVLATVAKKAYGPEEGNRLVNIDRIFKANRDTLETPDEIFVGQKLVIPPLPEAKPDTKLSDALFEKVEKIGKRNVAEVKDSTGKPGGRLYVVQDGDSLWKIASSQLGSGARWEELIKLNSDTLKSEEATLVIGMKLKLPAK